MQDVFALVETVAPTNSTILVRESRATGKELVRARCHTNSLSGPGFVALIAAALPRRCSNRSCSGTSRRGHGRRDDKKGLLEAAGAHGVSRRDLRDEHD